METPRSQKIRLMAGAMILLLWIPALALGVEVYERARTELGTRYYPRMLERRLTQPLRMAWADPDEVAARRIAPVVTDPTPFSPREEAPAIDTMDPSIAATLRGEMVMRVTEAGEVLEAYGEPAIETRIRQQLAIARTRPETVHTADAFITPREPISFEHWFFFGGMSRYYGVEVLPDVDAGELTIHAVDRTLERLHERLAENPPAEDDPWIQPFFGYKPHAALSGGESTNNFGFRDLEVTVPKPPGVFRIVCIGGSTTEEGGSKETTYPRLVEQHLKARFGDHVEVCNAGLMGMTTFTMLTRIEHYMAMEPDLLLFYGGVNDISHNYLALWLELRGDSARRIERSHALRRYFNRRLLPPDDEIRAFLRRTTLRNLEAIRFRAQQDGADMIVASFSFADPNRLNWGDRLFLDANTTSTWGGGGLLTYRTWCQIMDLYNDEVEAWCAEEGGPGFLPVADFFTGGAESFMDTCHVTYRGMLYKSRVFADLLGDYLERLPEFP